MHTRNSENVRTIEPRRLCLAALAAASLSAFATLAWPFGTTAYADDGNGLIVPLYGWDSNYGDVINAKRHHPGTEIIAVINPSGGPGQTKDPHWSKIIHELQSADITVAGYIATSYAGKGEGDVRDELDRYNDWYGVDGIFLDEVSPSALGYYKDIYGYENNHGIVILNPGAPVPEAYGGAADIVVVYENSGIPSGITSNGIPESKLGALPYGLEPSESEFSNLSDSVGYLYVSPGWQNAAASVADQAGWAD